MKGIAKLVLALVVIVAVYFGLRAFSQPEEFTSPVDLNISELTSDNLSLIKMTTSGTADLVLEKKDNEWFTGDFVVNRGRLLQLFEAFEKAEITSVASTNPDNYDRFDLTDKAVTLTMMKDDTTIQEWIVGKSAGGSSVYVTFTNSDETFVLEGLSRFLASSEQDSWRERKLLTYDKDQVDEILFQQGRVQQWNLSFDGKWRLNKEGFESVDIEDARNVDQFIAKVLNVQGSVFLTPEDLSTFPEIGPSQILVKTKNGQEMTWHVHPGDTDQEYKVVVNRGETKLGYTVAANTFDEAFLKYDELKEDLTKLVTAPQDTPIDAAPVQ